MSTEEINYPKVSFSIQYFYSAIFKVLLFLFIFAPFIKLGPIVLPLPYIVILILSGIFFIILTLKGVDKMYLFFILSLFLSYLYVFLLSTISSQIDLDILMVYVNGVFMLMAAYALAKICASFVYKDLISYFIKAVYSVTIIHALIMILVFFIRPLGDILYRFVVLGVKGRIFLETMTRSPGLTSGGGDSLSVIQSIGLCFGIYYFYEIERNKSYFNALKYFAGFTCLIISILLSARSGLIVLAFFLLFFSFKRFIHILVNASFKKSIFYKTIFITISLFAVLTTSFNLLMQSKYSRFANRSFEVFINYSQQGQLRTSSTDDLGTMYFLPESTSHFIFGDGNFGRSPGLPVIRSDVGYVRVIFGVGVLGLGFFYAPLFFPVLLLRRDNLLQNHGYFLLLFIFIVILIINFKVFHFFQFKESFKVYAMLFALLCLNVKR